MSEIQSLISTFQETVGSFRDEIEKQRVRVDELEALTKRAHAGGPRAAAAGDEDSVESFEGHKVLRKNASLTALQFGREGVEQAQKASLARILKGVATGNWRGAEYEMELVQKSAQSINSGPLGGLLIPDAVAASVLDAARPASVCLRMGAGIVPVDGHIGFPTLTGGPNPEYKGENLPFSGSGMTFGRINISPRMVGFTVVASRELVEDAAPSFEPFVRSVFASTIASELDRVLLNGQGASGEPLGIANWPGVGSTPTVGSLDFDDLTEAARSVFAANFSGDYSDLGIALNPRTMAALGKIVGTSNDHYIQFPPHVQAMRRVQSTNIGIDESSKTFAVVGDFKQAAIAVRTGLQIEVSTTAGESFARHQVAFKATMRVDSIVWRPGWFHILRGITN